MGPGQAFQKVTYKYYWPWWLHGLSVGGQIWAYLYFSHFLQTIYSDVAPLTHTLCMWPPSGAALLGWFSGLWGGEFFLYEIIFFLSKVFTIMLKIQRFIIRRNIFHKKTFHIENYSEIFIKTINIYLIY